MIVAFGIIALSAIMIAIFIGFSVGLAVGKRKSKAIEEYNKVVGGILSWRSGMLEAADIIEHGIGKAFTSAEDINIATFLVRVIRKNVEKFDIDNSKN